MSESVNEELSRIKSNIVNTYSTLSDVGLISEGDTNSDNLANTVKNLSWGGGELCDIGLALFIDESAGMRRLLNGQILNIESKYKPFLNKLQLIATAYPNILCTETEWQAIKESSPFGQVGKFVLNYDESGENVVSVRLPAVVNLQGLQDLQYLGDKLDEALPNITGSFTKRQDNNAGTMYAGGAFAENAIGNSDSYYFGNNNTRSGHSVSIDASRCSSAYKDNAHVQQEAIQYPYYIQVNLTEYNHMIDVGQIQDMLSRIEQMERHCVIESWSEGTEWYRIYADGWCEQGGHSTSSNITFLKEFGDTNYTSLATWLTPVTGSGQSLCIQNKTNSSMSVQLKWAADNSVTTFTNGSYNWEAKGYIAL